MIVSMRVFIYHTSRLLNYFAVGILILMMLLTVADVLMRYLLNSPILGVLELTEYMMVPVVYLGLAWCAVCGENVKVSLLVDRLNSRVQLILNSITCFFSVMIVSLLTWQNLLETKNMWEAHRASDILGIPAYPFYFLLSIGCFFLLLVLIMNLLQYLAQGLKKQ